MNKFIETATSNLAETWVAQVLSPAFAFWAGGLALWLWRREGSDAWNVVLDWSASLRDVSMLGVLIGFLLVVLVSGSLVRRTALSVLRVLEGYWPLWLRGPRRLLTGRQERLKRRLEEEWQAVSDPVNVGRATDEQKIRYVELDELLRRYPKTGFVMPTLLGNTLRSAELRAGSNHGLNSTVCWVYLWLLLPENARTEVGAARRALDGAAVAIVWSGLFAIWAVWQWWALLISAAASFIVWRGQLMPAARSWADLTEACFELYGSRLAGALRLEPTLTLQERKEQGIFVSEYLLGRDVDPDTPLAAPGGSEDKL